MAQKTLTTSYLAQLTNANHDGVTQQIDDRLQGFETDNTMLQQAATAVHTARQAEDTAYRRYTGKDFASDDLKREDALEDKYMSTIRALLNALLCLLDDEPLRRKATDEAIRRAYDILNALAVLQPTQELNALGELANSYISQFPKES